jgi:hypothetical protein
VRARLDVVQRRASRANPVVVAESVLVVIDPRQCRAGSRGKGGATISAHVDATGLRKIENRKHHSSKTAFPPPGGRAGLSIWRSNPLPFFWYDRIIVLARSADHHRDPVAKQKAAGAARVA